MNLIGLVGYARVGKDTACRNMPGWLRFAFADPLKADLSRMARLLGLNIAKLTPEQKEMFRPLMVAWGSVARKFQPDFWVRRTFKEMDLYQQPIVITDVRYVNEVEAVLNRGGKLVRICKPEFPAANDEEAESIAEIMRRFKLPRVINDSTPAELGRRVLEAVE